MKRSFRQFFLVALFSVFGLSTASAQQESIAPEDLKLLQSREQLLMGIADSITLGNLPEDRLDYVYKFVKELKTTLVIPNSFYYGFDSLSRHINIISPEDKAFRIFNWSVTTASNTERYYGAIQMPGSSLKLYGLIDKSAEMQRGAMDSVLDKGKWFGATYYRIMPVTVDGQQTYTLFGMNSANPLSNRKVLDLLWFTKDGPVFGAPVFGVRSPDTKQAAVRFILEYKKNIVVTLNYKPELNGIYFDHLESETNDPGRRYTYIPTGQYDGFRWQNGMWTFVKDIIPITLLPEGQQPIGGNEQY